MRECAHYRFVAVSFFCPAEEIPAWLALGKIVFLIEKTEVVIMITWFLIKKYNLSKNLNLLICVVIFGGKYIM